MRNNCTYTVLENFFEPCALFLLLRKPSYGYEIQQKLTDECMCSANMGNLYRCLSRMSKQGYVMKEAQKSSIGPTKYIYTITDKGQAHLASWIRALETQEKSIRNLITHYHSII